MKKNGKLELLEVLPHKEEVFVCEDSGRMDIYGKPMNDVHIEVRKDQVQVWYLCYGCLLEDFSRVCFGAEMSMEGACKVIAELIPSSGGANTESKNMICHAAAEGASMEALPCAESESLEKTGDCLDCEYCEFCDGLREGEQPVPESENEVTVAFSVKSEELHDLVSTYDEWEKLRCQVMPEKHRLGMDIPELYHLLAITGHDVMQNEVEEFRETLEARVYMESLEQDTNSERQQLKEEVRQAYLNGGRTPYLYDIDGNEYYTTRDGIRHYTRVEG